MKPLFRAVEVIRVCKDLVTAVYFCPRDDLDSCTACRNRLTAAALRQKAEAFFHVVRTACLRADMEIFGALLDMPILQRLRELVEHLIPALLHMRHAQELLIENANQQLKRVVVSGNGQEDAARALSRYQLAEVAPRLNASPSTLGIPHEWLQHPGVRACLSRSHPLFSVESGEWRCPAQMLPIADVPLAAQRIAICYCGSQIDLRWRCCSTRARSEGLSVGDAAAVLVLPQLSHTAVPVARGVAASRDEASTAIFYVHGFVRTRSGAAAAVVRPFSREEGGASWRLSTFPDLVVGPEFARRSLVLHDSGCSCPVLERHVQHAQANKWLLFGRGTGSPACSG